MKWPWVSRKFIEHLGRELGEKENARLVANYRFVEASGELANLKEDMAALQKEVERLTAERDEWRKTAEDFKKKLDAQPKPGFNPRGPRFHGPNGIAAQLEAASREDQKGNQ